MPCRDSLDDTIAIDARHLSQLRDCEAVLCGLLRAMDSKNVTENWLKQIDWLESGVPRGRFDLWWKAHKRADDARRAQEAKKQADARLREAVIAKLSADERRVLGIK